MVTIKHGNIPWICYIIIRGYPILAGLPGGYQSASGESKNIPLKHVLVLLGLYEQTHTAQRLYKWLNSIAKKTWDPTYPNHGWAISLYYCRLYLKLKVCVKPWTCKGRSDPLSRPRFAGGITLVFCRKSPHTAIEIHMAFNNYRSSNMVIPWTKLLF